MTRAVVLLAAYNGRHYVKELIDSIPAWIDILVSDDGSSDGTVELIKSLDRSGLYFLESPRSGSASKNFAYLINNVVLDYDYFFLADQDDVWIDGKAEALFDAISVAESRGGKEVPCLVFSDAQVVDERLKLKEDSFLASQGLNSAFKNNFKLLCCQNVGQGATFLFNRAMLSKLRPMPSDCIMHDWWMMLVAAAFGKIEYVDRALILYRQHSANVVGASRIGVFQQLKRFLFARQSLVTALYNTQINTHLFFERYGCDLDDELSRFSRAYGSLDKRSFLSRKAFALKHRLRKSTILRTIGFYTYI